VETNLQCQKARSTYRIRCYVGRVRGPSAFKAKNTLTKILFFIRYDEGTAFMPIVESRRLLPESDKFRFMALDEDGYDLPSDW